MYWKKQYNILTPNYFDQNENAINVSWSRHKLHKAMLGKNEFVGLKLQLALY